MTKWQPIETLPPPGRIVLLFAITDKEIGNWKMATGSYSEVNENWVWDGRWLKDWDCRPTHWMPLPEPPK